MSTADDAHELVFAVCHDVGNLLAAVRLQAHLLGDEAGPRALAQASVDVDDLSARAGALLAQIRPLLADGEDRRVEVPPAAVLAAVEATLLDEGLRGLTLEVQTESSMPHVSLDADALKSMLVCQVYGALETTKAPGKIVLSCGRDGDELVFGVEDDAADDDLDTWRTSARRGRPLACAVAAHILGRGGGRVSLQSRGTRRTLELRLLVPND